MTDNNAALANDTALPELKCTLTLETHNLNNADLHALVTSLTTLCNSRQLSSAASEDVIDLLHDAEAEYFGRTSATPADALRKVMHLASEDIKAGFSFGKPVLDDALAALEVSA